jgi:molecular chaperone GrpE
MSPDDRSSSARSPGARPKEAGRQPVDDRHEEFFQGPAGDKPREDPQVNDAFVDAPGAESGEAPTSAEMTPSAKELRDRWLRAEADLQNYRRRAQKDVEESVRFAEDRLLLESIGHLDDLERALSMVNEAGAPGPWVQGVQLVANRIQDDLARHGVTPMKPLGQRFDPELHEALLEVDAAPGVEPGHVVQVAREGYLRGGRALRPARVVVARRSEGT